MSNILLLSETHNGKVKTVTLEILLKVASFTTHVVTIGELSSEGQEEIKKFGANKVLQIALPSSYNHSPDGLAKTIAAALQKENYDYAMAGATSLGKDVLPRVAAIFDTAVAADITELSVEGTNSLICRRPFFAGKCSAKVEFTDSKTKFISVRPNALGINSDPKEEATEFSYIDLSNNDLKAVVEEVIKGTSEKLDLTEANIIVSGGRAMKNKENFAILNELADTIGATVGASRAAVDSGYADPSMQVGQTGKTVSPTLYIACGISGAIQHLAGMRTSKVIVAINTDPDAPIFAKADYGIVGDLFQVVPLLTKCFKKIL